jgi:hypothetical protein
MKLKDKQLEEIRKFSKSGNSLNEYHRINLFVLLSTGIIYNMFGFVIRQIILKQLEF